MKEYAINWTYYGVNGAEQGRLTITAKSPSEAEAEFYRYNRPVWEDEWGIGYCAESIMEVAS